MNRDAEQVLFCTVDNADEGMLYELLQDGSAQEEFVDLAVSRAQRDLATRISLRVGERLEWNTDQTSCLCALVTSHAAAAPEQHTSPFAVRMDRRSKSVVATEGQRLRARIRRPRSRVSLLIGTCVMLGVTVALTAFRGATLAELEETLSWIPGIGEVVASATVHPSTWVLPVPFSIPDGTGTISVSGVMVTADEALVRLNGEGSPPVLNVRLGNGSGKVLSLNQYAVSEGSWQWIGSYDYRGVIANPQFTVLSLGKGLRIKLHLVRANAFASYHDIGPTVTASGITITAVPQQVGDDMTVALVSRYAAPYQIVSYGLGLRPQFPGLTVRAHGGKVLATVPLPTTAIPSSQFEFSLQKGSQAYRLQIPDVKVQYGNDATVSIAIPAAGGAPVTRTETVTLSGYPLTVTRAVRVGTYQVGLDVRMDPVSGAVGRLVDFQVVASSSEWRESKEGSIDYLQLQAPPSATSLSLQLADAGVVIPGPWDFTLAVTTPRRPLEPR